MKTLKNKIAYLVLALVLCLNGFSYNNGGQMEAVKVSVQKEIQAGIHLAIEKSEKVDVLFTTDENGKVNLAIAKTGNETLKKAIEANFMKLSLSGLVPDNCYSITLNLKLV